MEQKYTNSFSKLQIEKASIREPQCGDIIYQTEYGKGEIVEVGYSKNGLVKDFTVFFESENIRDFSFPFAFYNGMIYCDEKNEKSENQPLKKEESYKLDSKGLFEQLKALRLTIAREESLPAFCIFSNETLVDLTDKQPTTKLGMIEIRGIGESKYIKYGERFLDVIRRFKNQETSIQEINFEKNIKNTVSSPYTHQPIKNHFDPKSKPVATLKKATQEPIKKAETNQPVKKKREQYTMDGKIYYLMNGKWVDSSFTTVSKEEMYKLNSMRIKNINFDDIETKELIEIAQEMKDNDDYIFSKKLFESLLEKCDDREVVRNTLSRYTSILRNLEQPEKAIEAAEKYISLYGNYVYTPALFTSLAGAYCDIEDYFEARKKANFANAMSAGKASAELISVYARIKAMEK